MGIYELVHCRCGNVYGERPESGGEHPCNFCRYCGKSISVSECRIERVPESVWRMTPKLWFDPKYS